MWILIDNYDSFSYILADYLQRLQADLQVYKNDAIDIDTIRALQPDCIILSPGPGAPESATLCMDIVHYFHQKIPILGICLGHQVIGTYFGATCQPSGKPLHGKTSTLQLLNAAHPLFDHMHDRTIMHYHSLIVVDYETTDLIPLAVDEQNQLMVCVHKTFPITGIQFHPESILTSNGYTLLHNWAKLNGLL